VQDEVNDCESNKTQRRLCDEKPVVELGLIKKEACISRTHQRQPMLSANTPPIGAPTEAPVANIMLM